MHIKYSKGISSCIAEQRKMRVCFLGDQIVHFVLNILFNGSDFIFIYKSSNRGFRWKKISINDIVFKCFAHKTNGNEFIRYWEHIIENLGIN